MSSTLLYKFRSGTTFEALPLPGSAARLFDVKKAIVTAKKLDAGTMDFDLSVRNAATNEEYNDEAMLLPRGTRLIVQRLPAAKGQGFLARMARNQYGISGGQNSGAATTAGGAPSGFYEIDSRARDDDDEEFISSSAGGGANDEDKELAALKAVTDTANTSTTGGGMRPSTSSFGRSGGPAGQGPPPNASHHHGQGGGGHGQQRQQKQRQNADPELREQEKKLMGRKRATGIPRTFLNLSAPPTTENKDGEGDGENQGPLLQPNTLGFEELKNRGGGQSENAAGTKKSLDYALKVTATTIPEYLQCALCNGVALTAMFLTWDPEGRTTCDKCIRDALTQNGFRDPLTGMEGISPDDLRPNPGIRKAAEAFVKEVMDKIEEIEKQQVDEEPVNGADASKSGNLLEGDGGGVVVTKRNSITKRKNKDEEDPFGGDDDFGGDVFAVAADEKPEDDDDLGGGSGDGAKDAKKEPEKASEVLASPDKSGKSTNDANGETGSPKAKEDAPQVDKRNSDTKSSADQKDDHSSSRSGTDRHNKDHQNRRENSRQRRGPPAGYQMGPAGGAANPHGATRDRAGSDDYSAHSQGGRGGGRSRGGHASQAGRGGGRFQDRGSYRGGRGGGRFQGRHGGRSGGRDDYASRSPPRDDYSYNGEDDGRSSKRPRNDSADYDSGSRKQDWDDRNGGGGGHHGSYNQSQGGGGYHNQGGYHHNQGAGGYNDNRGGGWGPGPRGGGRGGPPFRGGGGGWDRGGYNDNRGGGRWGGGRGRHGGGGYRGGQGGRRGRGRY